MNNSKQPRKITPQKEKKESGKQQKASLSEAKNDPSVKDALIKENSPTTPEDLSHLHDTVAIGTTGGDQRASEQELKADE